MRLTIVKKSNLATNERDLNWKSKSTHMTRNGLVLFLLLITYGLNAQDPIYSQFYAAPLQINPAFAGTTFGPRIGLNYRNQWPSINQAYVTYGLSYEHPIDELNSGLGIMIQNDVAGNGIYKTFSASGIYAYNLRLGRNFYAALGIEVSYSQQRLDWNQLIFLDQLDPFEGFDPTNPLISDELTPDNLSQELFDVGTGMLLIGPSFYGGFSIKHLTTPNETYLDVNSNIDNGLPMRITIHGGTEIDLKSNIRGEESFISPSIMYIKQGDFGQINAGSYFKMGIFFAGVWYRHAFSNGDALIFLAGYQKGIYKFGYSYDWTVSNGLIGRTGGSHEASFIVNFGDSRNLKDRKRKEIYNDCFRMFN